MFTAILLSFHIKEDVKLIKLQMSYDGGMSLLHNSPLLQNIINIDIFVNWNWLTPGGSNTAHI